jgi:hypothetical protein
VYFSSICWVTLRPAKDLEDVNVRVLTLQYNLIVKTLGGGNVGKITDGSDILLESYLVKVSPFFGEKMKLRIIPILLILMITACTSKEQAEVSEVLADDSQPASPAQDAGQADVEDTSEMQADEEKSSSQDEPASDVVIKTELEATDPTTVVLGEGQLTLVEFFAFW